jgi:hypothetical protein
LSTLCFIHCRMTRCYEWLTGKDVAYFGNEGKHRKTSVNIASEVRIFVILWRTSSGSKLCPVLQSNS